LYHEQLTELLTSPHSVDVEDLRRALDGKGEGARCGDGIASSLEQDNRYVANGTEEIGRREWSCKINRHFVNDIENLFCRV